MSGFTVKKATHAHVSGAGENIYTVCEIICTELKFRIRRNKLLVMFSVVLCWNPVVDQSVLHDLHCILGGILREVQRYHCCCCEPYGPFTLAMSTVHILGIRVQFKENAGFKSMWRAYLFVTEGIGITAFSLFTVRFVCSMPLQH